MPLRDQDWDQDPYERAQQSLPPPPAPPGSGPIVPPGPTPPQDGPTDFGTFEMPAYSGPSSPNYNFSAAPQFRPSRFGAPSLEQAQNEPGYQFRLQSGQGALESSAAARGVLRTGGTLKDLVTYGQNFGAQEYNNVFNRALQAYGTQYQAERDMFAPQFAQWQNESEAQRQAALAAFQNQFNVWQQSGNWQSQQEDRIADTVLGGGTPGDVSQHFNYRG